MKFRKWHLGLAAFLILAVLALLALIIYLTSPVCPWSGKPEGAFYCRSPWQGDGIIQ